MPISRRTFLTGAIAASFALPATGHLLAQTARPAMPRNSRYGSHQYN